MLQGSVSAPVDTALLEWDQTTVVLAGAWNNAILSPAWVQRFVFQEQATQVLVSLHSAIGQLTFEGTDATLRPELGRLVFTARKKEREVLGALETLSTRVLSKLPETPLRAVGANFAFSVAEADRVSALLEQLPLPAEWPRGDQQISHAWAIPRTEDGAQTTINVRVETTQEVGSAFRVHFNFNTNVTRPEAAIGLIANRLGARLDDAKSICGVLGLAAHEPE